MSLKIAVLVFLQGMMIQTWGDKCDNAAADIVMILDASRSIWEPDFKKQLTFVKTFAELVGVGRSETQISIITFGDTVVPIFDFNTHTSAAQIMEAIRNIKHLQGGRTYTHAALKYVRKNTFLPENGARPKVPHIAILMTDGRSSKRSFTADEAALLKATGVQVFAIGIGKSVSEAELETIASEPKENFVIKVRKFSDLEDIEQLKTLAYKACDVTTQAPITTTTTTVATTTTTTTEPPTTTTTTVATSTVPRVGGKGGGGGNGGGGDGGGGDGSVTSNRPPPNGCIPCRCVRFQGFPVNAALTEDLMRLCGGKPADVVFVLDKSSSIGPTDFPKLLTFVNNLVAAFDIGKDTTRVGVVSFSDVDTTRVEFPLDMFDNAADIQYAISEIHFSGGGTDTAAAIDLTRKHMFTTQLGSRPNVAHVAVVITDGQSGDPIATYKAAKDSHKRGISMFAIGVGSEIDKTELKDIASNPNRDFMFTVNNYDSLNSIRNLLAQKTCEVEQPQRDVRLCGVGNVNSDIIFALDTAGLTLKEKRTEMEFIKDVSSRLDIDGDRVRVGMVTTCSGIKLETSTSRLDFHEQLASVDKTVIAPVLSKARSSGYRRSANKILVLFVNGPLSDYSNALKEALRAKFKGIEIFVVGIGDDIDPKQLDRIASRPAGEHVLQIKNARELVLIQEKLEERLCYKV